MIIQVFSIINGMIYSIDSIREQFPVLMQEPLNSKRFAFLDNTATTQKPLDTLFLRLWNNTACKVTHFLPY